MKERTKCIFCGQTAPIERLPSGLAVVGRHRRTRRMSDQRLCPAWGMAAGVIEPADSREQPLKEDSHDLVAN